MHADALLITFWLDEPCIFAQLVELCGVDLLHAAINCAALAHRQPAVGAEDMLQGVISWCIQGHARGGAAACTDVPLAGCFRIVPGRKDGCAASWLEQMPSEAVGAGLSACGILLGLGCRVCRGACCWGCLEHCSGTHPPCQALIKPCEVVHVHQAILVSVSLLERISPELACRAGQQFLECRCEVIIIKAYTQHSPLCGFAH